MTYVPLCRARDHFRAMRDTHDQAVALHQRVQAEREAVYGDDTPLAVQVILDAADDLAGALVNASAMYLLELDPAIRRKLTPKGATDGT